MRVLPVEGVVESGVGGHVEGVGAAVAAVVVGESGDHGGVVGAEFGWCEDDAEAMAFGGLRELCAEEGVAGDAAAECDDGGVVVLSGLDGLGDEDVDDGGLEGGDEVGEHVVGDVAELVVGVEEGGLDAGEGEVEAVFGGDGLAGGAGEGSGEGVGVGVGALGEPVDDGASGISEAEDLGGLVEGLAGGVVEGGADDGGVAVVLDEDDGGVSAGDDEGEDGE